MIAGLLIAARFDDGTHVSVFADRVAVGGRVFRAGDFESSFNARHEHRRRSFVGASFEIEVHSWSRGFGCHVALCSIGSGPRGSREFRFVRSGLGQGWFDLDGVANGGGEACEVN